MHLDVLQTRLLMAAMGTDDLDDTVHTAPTADRIVPGSAAAAFALARALQHIEALEAIGTSAATMVKVPGPAWVTPVAQLLIKALGSPGNSADADAEGGLADTATWTPGLTLLLAPKAKDSAERDHLRERNMLSAMRARAPIVAVAEGVEDVVPQTLIYQFFEVTLAVEITRDVIDDCLRFYTGADTPPPVENPGHLEPRHLELAFGRSDVSAAHVAMILRGSASPRTTPAISLEHLHGMAPLIAWSMAAAEDLHAFRDGTIPWSQCSKGVLLSGPPGCGKTRAAEAVAHYLGVEFIPTSVAQWMTFRDGDLGDFCKAVRDTFDQARSRAPALLVIDECDALPSRGAGANYTWWNTAVNAVLEQLDGINGREGVLVMGMCNRPDLLDPALLRAGRLETHLHVTLPTLNERLAVLRYCLGQDLADIDLHRYAARLGGTTQATLAKIVADARRAARLSSRPLTETDLEASIVA
ncbi:AAA family ATPase [Devosia elaeis]|uniref:AAA+ ATPase domain-containing protein n=1 Tax=Devosia elaeis TaxID=1770058 RepID=A0A178HQZ1_9HYPH|nr:ATP-binding protein [Devosia elaeis]OAM74424.1 hypothetical protein A3840_15855 [Devosia elaeis]